MPNNDTISEDAEPQSDDRWKEIHDLIEEGSHEAVAAIVAPMGQVETARLISRLPETDSVKILNELGAEEAADILEDLPESQASDLIKSMKVENVVSIFHELPDELSAELLREVSDQKVEEILAELPDEKEVVARQFLGYEPETAGALMSPEILAFQENQTPQDLFAELNNNHIDYAKFEVLYAYVTTETGELRGVLRMRDVLLSNHNLPLRELMIADPVYLTCNTELEKMVEFFDDHDYLGVPVVDETTGRLVGVLNEKVVRTATEKRASNTFMKFSGIVGGEELRSLPLHVRCLRRLAFLAPNIILNLVAASVIAQFQDVIQAVIVLAVFLPIISDMSGCSGNQAVAVSIRELSLGLIRPQEVWRVFQKESLVGLLNGITLGIVLGTIAWLWKGNGWLGFVIGSALALNTLISVMLGGLVPLLLKRFKVDPALASGPILTTVTDMCGFFLVLSFANTMLDKL